MLYVNPGRDPSQSFSRIDVLSLGARLYRLTPQKQSEFIVSLVGVGLSCAVLWWHDRRHRTLAGLDPPAVFALLAMLLSIYHHAYDAMLVIPLLLAGWFGRVGGWSRWGPRQRAIWCALVAVPLVNYVSTNSVIEAWQIDGAAWVAVTCLNGAALLIAAVWLGAALVVEHGELRVES
jgi:hypothetical protein